MENAPISVESFLKTQRLQLKRFRIQGNTIEESSENNQSLECEESDFSDNDPDWSPNSDENSSGSEDKINENEKIKRLYRKETENIRAKTDTINLNKRAKRGHANQDTWEKNRNKRLRMQGEKYFGLKKSRDGKYGYIVERGKRAIKPIVCSKRCKECSTFSALERENIFNSFWNHMDWEQKRVYIVSMVDKIMPKQQKGEDSRRKYSFKYYLKKDEKRVQVCKKMLLATLDLGERTLYEWINKSSNGIPEKRVKQTNFLRKKEGNESAKEFFEFLPKMPSHYCRASSSKTYLEPVFTSFNELYREYEHFCSMNSKEKISIKVVRSVFEGMNLSLFQPKKDQCDTCCSFQAGNITEDEYRLHLQRKEEARIEKAKDKELLQSSKNLKVITIDLQAVLLCPFLKASAMYYKTKLACHNYTIHDMDSHDVSCYFWPENEGELTANSFSTCLYDYIDNLGDNINDIIIYSDGCNYQNRNTVLSNALLLLSAKKNIKITQKILEKGHTQMECDSVHSTIERKLRNKPIYTPQNYVDLIQQARYGQPYNVKYVSYDFFRNFQELKYYSSIRPGRRVGDPVVTDIRVLKYANGEIQYKLNFSDEFQDLPRKAKVSSPTAADTVNQLYVGPIKIKQTKYQHLQELKSVIPKDFHPYYDQLAH